MWRLRAVMFGFVVSTTVFLLVVVTSFDHTGWWLLAYMVVGAPLEAVILVAVYRTQVRRERPPRPQLDIADHVPPELLRDLGRDL